MITRTFNILLFTWLTWFPLLCADVFEILPTEENYYISSLIGENNYYAPNYFDDFYIHFKDIKWAHVTCLSGKPVDFYFYPSPGELEIDFDDIQTAAGSHEFLREVFDAYQIYLKTRPLYNEKGIYDSLADIIRKLTNTTVERVIGRTSRVPVIDQHLFRYLISNGIENINGIKPTDDIVTLIIGKFYMLSTTHFFRDWSYIASFVKYLPSRKNRRQSPVKLKVYACSSGEEVLSYALEMMDHGIENFRIFASDINVSSIEFAKRMSYPFNSFERLSDSRKKLVKKYFEMDVTKSIWLPRDKKFFQDRIMYAPQNLLEVLPQDLPAEFSPPYDVVSILNVLLYLEDNAVQVNKNYWSGLLFDKGLLILHDAKYNLYRGWLDPVWTAENYYHVNEWINIKWTGDLVNKEKQYRKLLKRNFSEVPFVALNFIYQVSGQFQKGYQLTQDVLKTYPANFAALSANAQYRKILDESKAQLHETYRQMIKYHGDHMTVINGLIDTEMDLQMRSRLVCLKDEYMAFLTHFRQDPVVYFNKLNSCFSQLQPAYSDVCRAINMNAMAIMSDYYKRKHEIQLFDLIRTSLFEFEKRLQEDEPKIPVLGKTLSETYMNLSEYLEHRGELSSATQIITRALEILNSYFKDESYFYYWFGSGMLNMRKFKLSTRQMDKRDKQEMLLCLDLAISSIHEAEKYIEELPVVKKSYFYGMKGECYFLRGQWMFEETLKSVRYCKKDLKTALESYEYALELNALYGKQFNDLRKEYKEFINRHEALAGL